jgi:hypothetical protein
MGSNIDHVVAYVGGTTKRIEIEEQRHGRI